jgi:hypothetical protein
MSLATRAAKEPAIRDGPSLGRKRRESRDDHKLRPSRPGRLWLFTHSAAATGGQLDPRKEKPRSAVSGANVPGNDQRGAGPTHARCFRTNFYRPRWGWPTALSQSFDDLPE